MTLKDRLQLACGCWILDWSAQPNPNWPSHRQAAITVLEVLKERLGMGSTLRNLADYAEGHRDGTLLAQDTIDALLADLTVDALVPPQPTVADLQATIERKTQRIIDLETENTRLTLALRPTE